MIVDRHLISCAFCHSKRFRVGKNESPVLFQIEQHDVFAFPAGVQRAFTGLIVSIVFDEDRTLALGDPGVCLFFEISVESPHAFPDEVVR